MGFKVRIFPLLGPLGLRVSSFFMSFRGLREGRLYIFTNFGLSSRLEKRWGKIRIYILQRSWLAETENGFREPKYIQYYAFRKSLDTQNNFWQYDPLCSHPNHFKDFKAPHLKPPLCHPISAPLHLLLGVGLGFEGAADTPTFPGQVLKRCNPVQHMFKGITRRLGSNFKPILPCIGLTLILSYLITVSAKFMVLIPRVTCKTPLWFLWTMVT